MKAIFFGKKESVFEDFELILEGLFSVEFVWLEKEEKLLELSKGKEDLLVIFTDKNNHVVNRLISEITKENEEIKLLYINSYGVEDNSNIEIKQIPLKSTIDKIKKVYEEMFNITRNQLETEYVPVKLFRFLRFNNTSADLYIKLSEQKYVKVIRKNEMYDTGLIEKYIKKGVSNFYIQNKDFLIFCEHFQGLLNQEFEKKNQSSLEKTNLKLSSLSFVHEVVASLGITKRVIELTDKITESNIKTVKSKNQSLVIMIDNMIQNKSFLYEHSLIISYIAIEIANQMDWASEATLTKLSIAAIFHDILLDDELAKLHDQDHSGEADLDWKQIKRIKEHPLQTAELLRKSEGIPPDVDNIILNHHELPFSNGYPRGISKDRITQISCIFILAEKVTSFIYKHGADKVSLLKENEEISEFNVGNFKKPYSGLMKILDKI